MSLHTYPYASQRTVTVARNGMVATSQPLAAHAGLEMLKKGGNAVDAAIATAACLTVVEPTSNGIGSDAFALVWMKDKLYGLNGSGPAPREISIEKIKAMGHTNMPSHGWIPVTVPGAPATWAELSKRFGKLSLTEVMKPAIEYAREGFPLSPTLANYWKSAFKVYKNRFDGDEFKEWFRIFAPEGRAPEAGEIWKSEDHARTLEKMATTNGECFYRGELAEKIAEASEKAEGFLRKHDLESYQPEWVEPIAINYRGYDIWEIPPNGQGIVALMTLNILKGFEFYHREDVQTVHLQLEAMKQAFTDGKEHVSDPVVMGAKISDMLSEKYGSEARAKLNQEARMPEAGALPKGGTVYLATADGEGNMVSFIQSNYMGFGSGIVVPGTGISLQNRGHDFSLNPAHVNALAPGKKTYHTIIPGFITKGNQAVGPFGVMGGYMQPQGHVQVVMNMIDFGLNPQAALDAPRWQWTEGKQIEVEHDFPNSLVKQLADRGHQMKVAYDPGSFGRGQIITRNPDSGVLTGGTEKRTDGTIACW